MWKGFFILAFILHFFLLFFASIYVPSIFEIFLVCKKYKSQRVQVDPPFSRSTFDERVYSIRKCDRWTLLFFSCCLANSLWVVGYLAASIKVKGLNKKFKRIARRIFQGHYCLVSMLLATVTNTVLTTWLVYVLFLLSSFLFTCRQEEITPWFSHFYDTMRDNW